MNISYITHHSLMSHGRALIDNMALSPLFHLRKKNSQRGLWESQASFSPGCFLSLSLSLFYLHSLFDHLSFNALQHLFPRAKKGVKGAFDTMDGTAHKM